MPDRHKELVAALEKYFAWRVQEEAAKPPNEIELRRAQRAKEEWLASGRIKVQRFPRR